MEPVSPVRLSTGKNTGEVVFAKDQPEYIPLPTIIGPPPHFSVLSRWELSAEDLANIMETKSIWIEQLTFGGGLNPMRPSTVEPTHL